MSTKVPKYEGPYGDEFDAAYDVIEEIVNDFKATIEDGFQFSDIAEWAPMIIKAYDVAKDIFEEEVDRDKVIAMAQYIYWAVDPDLPWIPEWVENKIEKWAIIELAIPLAVNAAWDAVENYKAKKDAE